MNQSEFDAAYENLTRTQKKVLKAFLSGCDDGNIAKSLNLSDRSGIRHHISNVCRLFALKNESDETFSYRAELVELFCQYKSNLVSSEVIARYQISPSAKEQQFRRSSLEQVCYDTLLQPGSLLRIKGLRQMGKTHFVTKIFDRLKEKGYQCVTLSLKLADRQHRTDLKSFLRWFCREVCRELQLPHQLDEYWEEDAGSKTNCTAYFEDYLLARDERPLVLCLDDLDLIFPHPEVYEDLSSLLRSWYESACSHPQSPWKKLRWVLVYSTEPYVRLNINISPFNVGTSIELPELTQEEARQWSRSCGLALNFSQVETLMAMVGGHPYLLELAFLNLKNFPQTDFEQQLAIAQTEAGIYGDHLRQVWLDLQQEPTLAKAFKKIITNPKTVQLNPIENHKLHRMGLVKRQGNDVLPRCHLYIEYFRNRLENN
ncbi:MAG: AAA-like domain-containing protein [Cyanobacteriota bacterium]|nr:AAA-like domain-containing protein [Cyanobacteriota bacterium]